MLGPFQFHTALRTVTYTCLPISQSRGECDLSLIWWMAGAWMGALPCRKITSPAMLRYCDSARRLMRASVIASLAVIKHLLLLCSYLRRSYQQLTQDWNSSHLWMSCGAGNIVCFSAHESAGCVTWFAYDGLASRFFLIADPDMFKLDQQSIHLKQQVELEKWRSIWNLLQRR